MSQQNSQPTDLPTSSQMLGVEISPNSLMIEAMGLASDKTTESVYFAEKIGGLTEQLKLTKEEIAKLSEKIDELEKNEHQRRETIRLLEATLEKLQKDLETVREEKEQLKSEFSKRDKILEEKLDNLTRDFEAVKNENKNLKLHLGKIQEEMHRKETRLALGQVAWILEAEIWKIVLPDVKMGTTRILYSMDEWLAENSTTEDGQAAQERWKELKLKLKWNDHIHRSALKILKSLRIKDAHPTDVDLNEASKQLQEGDYVALYQKKRCQQIIDMIKVAQS